MIRSILLALCLVFAGIGPSRAGNDPILAEATDLLGSVMFLDSGAPCMVLVVVRGDSTLFMRRDEIEAAWSWVEPILDAWAVSFELPRSYPAGSWGPSAAIALIERDGRTWSEDQ